MVCATSATSTSEGDAALVGDLYSQLYLEGHDLILYKLKSL